MKVIDRNDERLLVQSMLKRRFIGYDIDPFIREGSVKLCTFIHSAPYIGIAVERFFITG
jgi:hypothetical protein